MFIPLAGIQPSETIWVSSPGRPLCPQLSPLPERSSPHKDCQKRLQSAAGWMTYLLSNCLLNSRQPRDGVPAFLAGLVELEATNWSYHSPITDRRKELSIITYISPQGGLSSTVIAECTYLLLWLKNVQRSPARSSNKILP